MKHPQLLIQFAACFTGIMVTLLLEKYTSWDADLQNLFFDHTSGQWLVSEETHREWAWLFYHGLKYLSSATGISCVLILIFSFLSKFKNQFVSWRRPALLLLSSIILVPLTVSTLKQTTNICIPKQLAVYGGNYPNTPILAAYPKGFVQKKKAVGFPAGHSTAGFSLMALYFCFRSRGMKWIGLITGFSLGWIGGSYQMLRGEHFLSHTLVSMFIAWIIILFLYSFVIKKRNSHTKITA